MAIKTGDHAFQQRIEDAEKSYTAAVHLAESLPPGDENLIVALGRLGRAYSAQQKYTDATATFHRQLTLVEQVFGAGSGQSVEPLRLLGLSAMQQKNYKEAEGYFLRGLDISEKVANDNSPQAIESLRMVAGFYRNEGDYAKAETYMLRAVKGAELADPQDIMWELWGLCDIYDHWDKPDKSQSCYHRATEILETQYGYNSPNLTQSLKNEAQALRKLGKNDEAAALEERLSKIQRTAQN